jgi:hypothetical protein
MTNIKHSHITGLPCVPPDADMIAMIRCIEAVGEVQDRERARQAQADRIASLSQDEALQLVVLRRQGYGAIQAVDMIIERRPK